MALLWLFWLLVLVAGGFVVLETYALRHNRLTLSRFTYNITRAFPLAIFLLGLLAGGLAVHFWWHWCPPGSVSGG